VNALPSVGNGGHRIQAVVFDFDGLMVDTEGPIFRAWQRIYQERGQELPLERWLTIIGTASGPFDPVMDLAERTGQQLDSEELRALERLYYREATALQQLLPGVDHYLHDARRLEIKVAIASSSGRTWVTEHLDRFGIGQHFDAIVCREDVTRTKPDPELYQAALRALQVNPDAALALEDSRNGIRAAKAAGLFCVAIANPLTASMDLSQADLRLPSLDALSLRALIDHIASARAGSG
jgi:HAD superfamily hydrolase (TIGR01509 family)